MSMFFHHDLKSTVHEQSRTGATFQRLSLRAVPRLIRFCRWEFEEGILADDQFLASTYTEYETNFIICSEWKKCFMISDEKRLSQSRFSFCLGWTNLPDVQSEIIAGDKQKIRIQSSGRDGTNNFFEYKPNTGYSGRDLKKFQVS